MSEPQKPKQSPLLAMVAIIVIGFFGLLELYSLFAIVEGESPRKAKPAKVETPEPPEITATSPREVTANTFIFRGHHYIMFKVNFNYGDTTIHDPDCPCNKGPLPLP